MTDNARRGKKPAAPPAPKTRDEREAELHAQLRAVQDRLAEIELEKAAELAAARRARAAAVFAAIPALLTVTAHAHAACDDEAPWGTDDACPRCRLNRCRLTDEPLDYLADLTVGLS